MSSLPRLEFEQLEAGLASYLDARVKRLGYLGEFFKCAGHQPHALVAFMEFTEASKADLPKSLIEVIALTVAGSMGSAYERNQHERLSIRLGFGRDWVAAVNLLAPEDQSILDRGERAVQRLVLTILDSKGQSAKAQFEAVVEDLGPEQAMAVLLVAGRYVVHALVVNTLQLVPPVPSIFEDGFDG